MMREDSQRALLLQLGRRMNQQLDELQMHIAFQEHTISELNEALIGQQKQLDLLRLGPHMLR